MGGGGYIIGYGFPSQKWASCISRQLADAQLFNWINDKAIQQIYDRYAGHVTNNQLAALVSFDFNTGITRPVLYNEKVYTLIVQKDFEALENYVVKRYAPLRGNVIRRKAEVELMKTP